MAATEMAQSKHTLVGTWKLVSCTDTREKGGVTRSPRRVRAMKIVLLMTSSRAGDNRAS